MGGVGLVDVRSQRPAGSTGKETPMDLWSMTKRELGDAARHACKVRGLTMRKSPYLASGLGVTVGTVEGVDLHLSAAELTRHATDARKVTR